jgi:hypothetical protein
MRVPVPTTIRHSGPATSHTGRSRGAYFARSYSRFDFEDRSPCFGARPCRAQLGARQLKSVARPPLVIVVGHDLVRWMAVRQPAPGAGQEGAIPAPPDFRQIG